jgi:SAM-dependent methyltransferase
MSAADQILRNGDDRAPSPAEGLDFGSYYYAYDCGEPYERSERWLGFFDEIAARIVSDLAPGSVLDAGCALGMLVEALRKLGVEAYGVDISEFAIEQADPSIRDHVWQASLTDPLPRRYDLVTCIEVVEHVPGPDAERVIDNLCAASDRILFSSSPFDYGEPTHVNVKQPDQWAEAFARRGFFRDLDADMSFLTGWAVLYEHRPQTAPQLVRSYERDLWQRTREVQDLRQSVLALQERLEQDFPALQAGEKTKAELIVAHDELLQTRDELIGTQAELGVALGKVTQLDAELSRYRTATAELNQFMRSPVWRYYEPYQNLRRRIGTKARSLLRKVL